jgi:hypothetical protein
MASSPASEAPTPAYFSHRATFSSGRFAVSDAVARSRSGNRGLSPWVLWVSPRCLASVGSRYVPTVIVVLIMANRSLVQLRVVTERCAICPGHPETEMEASKTAC